jgi:hypothetical protein
MGRYDVSTSGGLYSNLIFPLHFKNPEESLGRPFLRLLLIGRWQATPVLVMISVPLEPTVYENLDIPGSSK